MITNDGGVNAQEYIGKVAVITGAGRGFGRAFGLALASRGAHVVLLDVDSEAVEAVAAEVAGQGGKTSWYRCDVSNEAEFEAIAETIRQELGGVDFLINNASLHSIHYNLPMADMGIDKIRRMFDVNVMGVIIGSLAFREAMKERPGAAIVNLSSWGAYQSGTTYGVSKLAVIGLTMTMAREFGAFGIRVNAIAPGTIHTETIKKELPEEYLKQAVQQQCIQRPGEEKDVVEAMLYLISERSGFITGETLKLSGGKMLSI